MEGSLKWCPRLENFCKRLTLVLWRTSEKILPLGSFGQNLKVGTSRTLPIPARVKTTVTWMYRTYLMLMAYLVVPSGLPARTRYVPLMHCSNFVDAVCRGILSRNLASTQHVTHLTRNTYKCTTVNNSQQNIQQFLYFHLQFFVLFLWSASRNITHKLLWSSTVYAMIV